MRQSPIRWQPMHSTTHITTNRGDITLDASDSHAFQRMHVHGGAKVLAHTTLTRAGMRVSEAVSTRGIAPHDQSNARVRGKTMAQAYSTHSQIMEGMRMCVD